MIDLGRTREQMLAEIAACDDAVPDAVEHPSDPRFLMSPQARLTMKGHTREELLAPLRTALRKRFRGVSHDHLMHDLVYVLKKGLGNAYKRGNLADPSRWITLDVVATDRGAMFSVSDDGEGFDVAGTHQRFLREQQYYTHGGSGLTTFEKSRSVVSYADGGRTLLVRFLCNPEPGVAAGPPTEAGSFGPAADGALVKSALAALPAFRRVRSRMESCSVYVPKRQNLERPELEYVVEYREADTGPVKERRLNARLLPAHEARADFAVAQQLYKGAFKGRKSVRIPRPVAVMDDPASIALYRFDPTGDLRTYLKDVDDSAHLMTVVGHVADGLRAIHGSDIVVDLDETIDGARERLRETARRAATILAVTDRGRGRRVEEIWREADDRADGLTPCDAVPIHGRFGWDCILHDDSRRRLYLYRFEAARRSHPGFDIGGFIADLIRFYMVRKKRDPAVYSIAREVFLDAYRGAQPLAWEADVGWYTVAGLLARLDRMLARPEKKWAPKVDAILDHCEGQLSGRIVAG